MCRVFCTYIYCVTAKTTVTTHGGGGGERSIHQVLHCCSSDIWSRVGGANTVYPRAQRVCIVTENEEETGIGREEEREQRDVLSMIISHAHAFFPVFLTRVVFFFFFFKSNLFLPSARILRAFLAFAGPLYTTPLIHCRSILDTLIVKYTQWPTPSVCDSH